MSCHKYVSQFDYGNNFITCLYLKQDVDLKYKVFSCQPYLNKSEEKYKYLYLRKYITKIL